MAQQWRASEYVIYIIADVSSSTLLLQIELLRHSNYAAEESPQGSWARTTYKGEDVAAVVNVLRAGGGGAALEVFSRPRTVADPLAGKRVTGITFEEVLSKGKPTKLLLKVTIERSLGPVQVVMSPEGSVKDLIAAALLLYVKEGRRPLLPSTATADFELHYSQFSLESLKVEEKLMALGSRNFFLCRTTAAAAAAAIGSGGPPPTSSCSRAAKKQGLPWLKFIDFNF